MSNFKTNFTNSLEMTQGNYVKGKMIILMKISKNGSNTRI